MIEPPAFTPSDYVALERAQVARMTALLDPYYATWTVLASGHGGAYSMQLTTHVEGYGLKVDLDTIDWPGRARESFESYIQGEVNREFSTFLPTVRKMTVSPERGAWISATFSVDATGTRELVANYDDFVSLRYPHQAESAEAGIYAEFVKVYPRSIRHTPVWLAEYMDTAQRAVEAQRDMVRAIGTQPGLPLPEWADPTRTRPSERRRISVYGIRPTTGALPRFGQQPWIGNGPDPAEVLRETTTAALTELGEVATRAQAAFFVDEPVVDLAWTSWTPPLQIDDEAGGYAAVLDALNQDSYVAHVYPAVAAHVTEATVEERHGLLAEAGVLDSIDEEEWEDILHDPAAVAELLGGELHEWMRADLHARVAASPFSG